VNFHQEDDLEDLEENS